MATISQHSAARLASSLVVLRKGAEVAPLFLFSGGDGNSQGLSALACRLRNLRAVIGVDFCRRDNHGQLPPTIELMADRSCNAIRMLQPRGPYFIVGYSVGGLVAIEVARLFRQSGEEIALLGLIDTFFDHRFWPMHVFVRSQARLIRRHLSILLRLPPSEMLPKLFNRSQRFILRCVRRQIAPSVRISTPKDQMKSVVIQHCIRAMSSYRPKRYAGKIMFFNAENHDDYGCDPAELWKGVATESECRIISGTHVDIISNNASLMDLAAALDSYLDNRNSATPRT